MTKRILSMVLSVALLLSCISGITLFTAAEENALPTPYIWIDIDEEGNVTSNTTLHPSHIDPTQATKISDEEGYGLRLFADGASDWQGFWFGSDPLVGTEAESLTLLIEYYVASAGKVNDQLFRVMPAQNYDANGVAQEGELWIDYFTHGAPDDGKGNDLLTLDQTAVLAYTYPAAQLDALRETGMAIGIKGCAGSNGNAYIKSVKIVDSKYVKATDRGCAYIEFEGSPVSDYYPDVAVKGAQNLSTFPEGDVFTHFKVQGKALATDNTKNKPVYIRVLTKEGYENTTIMLQQYEAYTPTGRWACDNGYAQPIIEVTNGEGSVLLAETSFTNGNNGGSFRIPMADAAKLASVEVYDVTTYCAEATATDELKTLCHEYKLNTSYGVTTVVGATGTKTTCDACDAVLMESTSTLPIPYAQMDAGSGTALSAFSLTAQGGGMAVPVQIPGTEEYGIPLTADWAGFSLGGNLLADVADGQSVTMVVEYYITKDYTFTDRHQLFRYQAYSAWTGGNGNPAWYDMFTDTDALLHDQSALFHYTFTAEDIAALKGTDFAFTILGCFAGANEVYIQSMKLVNTEYVHPIPAENPFAYVNFDGHVLCDYYEEIVLPDEFNAHAEVLEVRDDFAGYTYVNVYGPAAGGENNANKPIVLKLYASKGNENATVTDVNIDVSDASGASTWHVMEPITFVDGEATVVIDACLKNRLNNAGSLRIGMDQMEKVARLEIYDVLTYCNNANSSEEIDFMHDVMLKNGVNTKKVGAKEATTEEAGYTGDTVCATCDTVLKYGVVIPVQDDSGLPTPYAQFDTAGGVLSALGVNVLPVAMDGVTVETIGATGEAGIKLPADWYGIQLNGMSLATLGEGKKAALVIEYFVNADLNGDEQMFRYRINGGKQTDIFAGALTTKESGVICHVFTDEELAAIGDADFSVDILGCAGGANITYIQSAKLISTEYLHVDTDKGYIYTTFEKAALCDYYPDIQVRNAHGITYADLEKDLANFPDTNWLYRYFCLQGAPLASNPTAAKPVYIKIYTNEENLNTTVRVHSYEVSNGSNAGIFGDGFGVDIVDGVGTYLLPKACFTNGLNGIGSFRIFYTEVSKIERIEVYDVASYCLLDDADEELAEEFHAALLANRYGLKVVGKVDATTEEEGYSGDLYCANCDTLLESGRVLPKLEESNLPDPYVWITTTNGNYSANGAIVEVYSASGTLDVLPIGTTGEYGIPLKADWSGFRMSNVFDAVPAGEGAVLAIEYFIDSDATGQMLRYRLGGESAAQVDIFTTSTDCHTSRLILVPFTAEEVAAAKENSGFYVDIMGCDPGKNVTYIQSVRLIDPQYAQLGGDYGYDYMSFVDMPICDYYPDIVGRQSNGINLTQTHEGADENGEIYFGYFALTQALLKEGEAFCPVVIRMTFKEGCTLNGFNWQYQCKAEPQPDFSEWGHTYSSIVDGVVEVLIDEATFTNKLNNLGSVRLPNTAVAPVLDNLVEIRVMRMNDTTELKELVQDADSALEGKTYASQEAYKEALANAQQVLENGWATEAMIADAIAALQAAEAMLEVCAHIGNTKVEGYVEETCLIPGYEGDIVCEDCGFKLEEGNVIPAHETSLINVKEATCGETGYTGDVYCEQCGKVVKAGEELMSPPHTWDDGVVTKDATPSERGEITITCQVCGGTKIKYFDFEATIGDVNEDGATDSTDARLILQFAVQKIAPSALNLDVADVDGNGKVDSTDARLVLQYAVGKIQVFPAEQ